MHFIYQAIYLGNDMKILNTATSFTHIFKKLVLKKFEQVEHSTNHNFYLYYRTKSFIITIITTTMTIIF